MSNNNNNDIGFEWWGWWGSIGLVIGGLMIFAERDLSIYVKVLLFAINSVLMLFVLFKNKYAFLISTILSLNPLIWIINGIYLKNRWKHPKVNNDSRIQDNDTI